MFKKFLFSIVLLAHSSLFADTSQIESMEKQRWDYIKNHNWKDLENIVAPYFQVVYYDGAWNKEQFMNQIKLINISEYSFGNFKITEGPGIAIATYDINVSETIEGKRLSSRANRLSVWQNNGGKWQMIAHAVLIPVPSSDASDK